MGFVTARVRSTREGNVLTRVCLSVHRGVPVSHNALQHFPECHGAAGGGYPYPIMLCNISQNAMGQLGGYPARSSRGGYPGGGYPVWGVPCLGGYPVWGVPCPGGTLAQGGTLARGAGGVPWQGGTLVGGVPCPGGVPWPGVPWLGGYPAQGGTLARGYPVWGGTLPRGGTQLGQHREYLLHGGRYASCVHAGGLSCFRSNS